MTVVIQCGLDEREGRGVNISICGLNSGPFVTALTGRLGHRNDLLGNKCTVHCSSYLHIAHILTKPDACANSNLYVFLWL